MSDPADKGGAPQAAKPKRPRRQKLPGYLVALAGFAGFAFGLAAACSIAGLVLPRTSPEEMTAGMFELRRATLFVCVLFAAVCGVLAGYAVFRWLRPRFAPDRT